MVQTMVSGTTFLNYFTGKEPVECKNLRQRITVFDIKVWTV